MLYDYDLIVIGGGSGGLVAARQARAFGARVALIDKSRLGGDCLHYGCVPSKTLIHIARVAHQIRRGTARGVITTAPTIDMPVVAATIAGVIDTISHEEEQYVEGVDVRFGHAVFRDAHTLDLDGTPLSAKSFIIATGSRPAPLAAPGADLGYLTNEEVFDLRQLPASLVIVGGGPIGCELAQAFARLGSSVTLIQRGSRLLPREEPAASEAVYTALAADGVRILTNTHITALGKNEQGHTVTTRHDDQSEETIQAEQVLAAVGRIPNVEDLGLEKIGVALTPRGITVDSHQRTSIPSILAIGDVAGGLLFTHVAAAQAGYAAPNAFLPGWLARSVPLDIVPWVTFTAPEVARVGLTEDEARAKHGTAVRVIHMPWSSIDRAQAEGATAGFIKLVLGKKDVILGAHLVGDHAGEVLGEVTLAMRYGVTANDIARTIHAYPTLTTGLQQVAYEAYLTSTSFRRAAAIVRRGIPRR